eukprot:7747226-Lingulodinium_polyedra.AAC.1
MRASLGVWSALALNSRGKYRSRTATPRACWNMALRCLSEPRVQTLKTAQTCCNMSPVPGHMDPIQP